MRRSAGEAAHQTSSATTGVNHSGDLCFMSAQELAALIRTRRV
jgi:hypothetical protein